MSALRHILPFLLCPAAVLGLRAQDARVAHTDSVEINFKASKWDIDPSVGDNAAVLDSIRHRLSDVVNDSVYSIVAVRVYGGASPEGSAKFNRYLSEQRAASLFTHIEQYRKLSDGEKTFSYLGSDWESVLRHARKDLSVPYYNETIQLLSDIAEEKRETGQEPADALSRLRRLRKGIPEAYLRRRIYPGIRASRIAIDYERQESPLATSTRIPDLQVSVIDSVKPELTGCIPPHIDYTDEIAEGTQTDKPLYMAVRTNMLYDALLLPNIGVDFHLGKGFTVGANWMYGWWSDVRKDRIWRAYGGELNLRWFPWWKTKRETPFNGHHFGLYGQIYTYDFEWGSKGEMGGKPLGSLGDRCFWSAGVEYGYTLPIAKRLSIDFSLGIGYTTGIFIKYSPDHISTGDIHHVWHGTHRRRFFGPTKAEIALVWLIGKGNTNRRNTGRHMDNVISGSAGKGGAR